MGFSLNPFKAPGMGTMSRMAGKIPGMGLMSNVVPGARKVQGMMGMGSGIPSGPQQMGGIGPSAKMMGMMNPMTAKGPMSSGDISPMPTPDQPMSPDMAPQMQQMSGMAGLRNTMRSRMGRSR